MRPTPRAVRNLATAVVLTLALAACAEDDPGLDVGEPAPAEDGDDGTDEAGEASGDSVAASAFSFSPATLTVAAGTTVTFANEDDVRHTVTSGAGEPDGTFDLDLPGPGDTDTFTFDEPGSYDYYCQVHPSMTAVVVVE